MKPSVFIIAGLFVAFGHQSCKKDDAGRVENPLNSKERMIVGSWTIESKQLIYTYTGGGTNTIDNMDPCEVDDIYTFTDDRKYRVSDGTKSCNNSGATYTATFDWNVTRDSLFEFVHGPGLTSNYPVIVQLDNTTLKIRQTVPPNGQEYYVYKRK